MRNDVGVGVGSMLEQRVRKINLNESLNPLTLVASGTSGNSLSLMDRRLHRHRHRQRQRRRRRHRQRRRRRRRRQRERRRCRHNRLS